MLSHKFQILLAVFLAFFIFGCSSKLAPSSSKPSKDTPATMRPYKVLGKTYYPQVVKVGDTQKGIASWYGPNFHGKKTSNGETYNMNAMTAAHKTYPMNTIVKVTNQNTKKSTKVRINDRGPFVSGRIIDLSRAAAKEIGVFANGTAPVVVEVLGFDRAYNKTASIKPRKTTLTSTQTASQNQVFVGGNFMVQIGAFSNPQGAKITQAKYNGTGGHVAIVREYEDLHRVFLTGFLSEEEARDFARSGELGNAFIVRE